LDVLTIIEQVVTRDVVGGAVHGSLDLGTNADEFLEELRRSSHVGLLFGLVPKHDALSTGVESPGQPG
jgi:hypothetical protein